MTNKGLYPVLLLLLLSATCFPSGATDATPSSVVLADVHVGGGEEWEHVLLENRGEGVADLSDWTLTDGEGTWRIPQGTLLGPGVRVGVARNATAFLSLWGRLPDVVPGVEGRFCLADRGDGLALRDGGGRPVDQLLYGAASGDPPPGWVGDPVPTTSTVAWGCLLRRGPGEDTDGAADWVGWTEPRCGWLEGPPETGPFEVRAATFVTPGGGWAALAGVIGSAEEDVLVALYDITSQDVAAALAAKAREGARVRLLLEGQPVGAEEEGTARRDALLAGMATAGVEVHETVPHARLERNRPYRYHHEKCCVVDGLSTLVTTENWGASSFPASGGGGAFASRGWGAVIESREMASALTRAIVHDIATCARPWEGAEVEPAELGEAPPPGDFPQMASATARLLVGPEAWGQDMGVLLGLMGAARETIHLELASLELRWGTAPSPLVEALLDAAAGGVRVKLLLDPGFDGTAAATLKELEVMAGLRGAVGLRAALAEGIPGVSRVHAKGAVVDDRLAILGSMNWAWSSVSRNREVVVALESEAAVATVSRTFQADWVACTAGASTRPPLSLVAMVLASRGQVEPGTLGGPVHTIRPVVAPEVPAEEPSLPAAGRALIVTAVAVSLWAVERRFGPWAALQRWAGRHLRRARRFMPRRGGAPRPGATGAGGPAGGQVQGPPQGHPPPAEPPLPGCPQPLGPGTAGW